MLTALLKKYRSIFYPVVPLNAGEKIASFNLSETNTELTAAIFGDTKLFSKYIEDMLQQAAARYGIGGYLENRKVYARSKVFNAEGSTEEPRSLHLGVDIWGEAGTKVMAPLDGFVHSIGYHPEYGNYGATIIIQHKLEEASFFTLYGHLACTDLQLKHGDTILKGQVFAHFGPPEENGHWPPHLHFQIIADLQGNSGDYPGVCATSKVDFYRHNCPNPASILVWDKEEDKD